MTATIRRSPVKTALTRKRVRREVENPEFNAFCRRILAAYGRRVATGDIEALTHLTLLTANVDTAIRAAVQGLRALGYSWTDIAARLGTSRQAAQQRFGTRTERYALDPRILTAGLSVTVATLVTVYLDHDPGRPAAGSCPHCGHQYTSDEPACPTGAFVRRLLHRRRHEDPCAMQRLSADQREEILAPPGTPWPQRPSRHHPGLFEPDPLTPPGGRP
jgi:hypothetical protein